MAKEPLVCVVHVTSCNENSHNSCSSPLAVLLLERNFAQLLLIAPGLCFFFGTKFRTTLANHPRLCFFFFFRLAAPPRHATPHHGISVHMDNTLDEETSYETENTAETLLNLIVELNKHDQAKDAPSCENLMHKIQSLDIKLGGILTTFAFHCQNRLAESGAVRQPSTVVAVAQQPSSVPHEKRKKDKVASSSPAPTPTQWIGTKRRRQNGTTASYSHIQELFDAAVCIADHQRIQFRDYEISDQELNGLDDSQLRRVIYDTLQQTFQNEVSRKHKTLSVHDAFWGGRYLCLDLERFRVSHWNKMKASNYDPNDLNQLIQVWDCSFVNGVNWSVKARPNFFRLFYLAFKSRPELMRSFLGIGKMGRYIEANGSCYKALLSYSSTCDWSKLTPPTAAADASSSS
jgi:hypothetical protein